MHRPRTQLPFAESFHSRLRDEFLATEEFECLSAARQLSTAWKEDYNHHRPNHGDYMAGRTPVQVKKQLRRRIRQTAA